MSNFLGTFHQKSPLFGWSYPFVKTPTQTSFLLDCLCAFPISSCFVFGINVGSRSHLFNETYPSFDFFDNCRSVKEVCSLVLCMTRCLPHPRLMFPIPATTTAILLSKAQDKQHMQLCQRPLIRRQVNAFMICTGIHAVTKRKSKQSTLSSQHYSISCQHNLAMKSISVQSTDVGGTYSDVILTTSPTVQCLTG